MLVTAVTGLALVTSASSSVLQHLLRSSSASPELSGSSSSSPGMPAAASALPAAPALSPGVFLQSHALTKQGLLLGSPGGSGCRVWGSHDSCCVLWPLTCEGISPCTPGSLHTFPCPPGPHSWDPLHMTLGAGCVGEGEGQGFLPRTLTLSPQGNFTCPVCATDSDSVCHWEGEAGAISQLFSSFFSCSASEQQGTARPLDGPGAGPGPAVAVCSVPRALSPGTRALCVLLPVLPSFLQCLTPAGFSLCVQLPPPSCAAGDHPANLCREQHKKDGGHM